MLPESVLQTSDPAGYVCGLVARDPIVAGQVALAVGGLAEQDFAEIVGALEALCRDTSRILRIEAALVLRQLGGKEAEAALLRLLDAAPVDVRMEALLELVRRRSAPALTWLRGNLDWEERDGAGVPGSVAVIRALEMVGDAQAQSEILRLWQARRHVFNSEEAADALTRLREAGRLTTATLDSLMAMLFDEPDEQRRLRVSWNVTQIVGDALPARWLSRVLKVIESSPSPDGLARNARKLLEASKLDGVTERLLAKVEALSLPDHTRGALAAAAAERGEEVSVGRWLRLTGDLSRQVQTAAIKALQRRARWEEIEEVVLPLLQFWRGEPDYERRNDDAHLQEVVFRLLTDHDRLDLLTHNDHRPEWFYENALEYLTATAVQSGMVGFAALFRGIVEKNPATRMGVRAAFALARLGHEEQGLRAVRDALRACIPLNEEQRGYYQHETTYIPHDVLEHAPTLAPGIAMGLIEEARAVHRAAVEEEESPYFEGCTVDALEKVATREARAALKAMYSTLGAGQVEMPERIFRALVYVGTAEDEPWLVAHLSDPHLDVDARRRALEALSRFGTQRSVPALTECATRVDASARIRDAAVLALHHIRRRQGTFWLPYGEGAPTPEG